MPGKAGGDAKALLKEGRKALAAGQYDRAQDLARAAEANNPTGKWGLFDDTPNSLLKDVQAAALKADKNQADVLVKQAKGLFSKRAQSEAEKAANLDQALQMAQRADQLHGPYSAWEFGLRPDKLVKDIQVARSKLTNVPPPSGAMPSGVTPGTTVANGGGAGPQFIPTGANMPARATSANDPKKAIAVQLINEGRKLADQGMFPAARAKLVEADRVGAAFSANEYSPGFALNDLNTRGKQTIERLIHDSRAQMAKKDFIHAEAALNTATEIASALGLFARPIDDVRTQLRSMTNGKFGGPAGTETAAAPGVNPAAGTVASVGTKPVLPAAGGAITGRQLLDQAMIEFKNGDLDMATKLATQANNQGLADEARGLLNSIDAERLTQKKMTAERSFQTAETAYQNKDYNHAIGVLVLIDTKLLPEDMKGKRDELIGACRAELNKLGLSTGVAATGGTQQPGEPPVSPGLRGSDEPPLNPGITPPGNARVGSDPTRGGADSVANQVDAMRKVQFQKLRSDGLKIQSDAQAAFGRGETDLAIQMLVDYANRVRAGNLEPASVAMLLRPIESRLEMFQVMKGQADALARQSQETRDAKEMITGRGAAEEQRKAEVASLVRKYHTLVKSGNYSEAEKTAMVAKQLDPDNPAVGALAEMARLSRRVKDAERIKADKEAMFREGLNNAERVGQVVDIGNPVAIQLEASLRARGRGANSDYIRSRSPAEYEIEVKLEKPISIEFSQTPLDQAVKNLQDLTGLPLVIDYASLDSEGLSAVKPITVKPGKAVAAKHILSFTLEQAGLSYVVENELVKITSTRKAKGRLYTKVFSVADLVTPIPNFALPDYANFEKMMQNAGPVAKINGVSGSTPYMPSGGLNGGAPTGTQAGELATTPGISGGLPFGPGGRLDSQQQWQSGGPLSASAPITGERNSKHEQLIRLITKMVRPYSWDDMGGPGRLEYFDIGSALVVNQTADVIKEVEELLEALRRLQDLAMAVEIRIVSLSESWYERMGVDFSMNIKTHTASFEPALTQIDPSTGTAGVFRPTPFINDINNKGVTVGLSPAGTFTPDLDVPIRPKTFEMAVPPFGGYPNTPGQQRWNRAGARVPERYPGLHVHGGRRGRPPRERDAGSETDPVQRPDGNADRAGHSVLRDERDGAGS